MGELIVKSPVYHNRCPPDNKLEQECKNMKKIFNLILVCFIVMIIFLNTENMVLTQESKEVNQELAVNDLNIREEHEGINVNMIIPVIEGMKDKEVEKKINQLLQKDAFDFKEELQIDSEEYLKGAKKEGWEIRKYEASSYYIVHFQSKNILSISVFYYRYTLGAHGYTLQKAYNINLRNGEKIFLSDVLKDVENYKEIINQKIKKQIQLNPEEYFNEKIFGKIFKAINDEQPFYIIENGIVVYFGLYKIAPYASGIKYFKIPFSLKIK